MAFYILIFLTSPRTRRLCSERFSHPSVGPFTQEPESAHTALTNMGGSKAANLFCRPSHLARSASLESTPMFLLFGRELQSMLYDANSQIR